MVFFRVDASLLMGSGHVMRCLALAEALKANGAECHFICREHPGNMIDFIRSKGYQTHALAYNSEAVATMLFEREHTTDVPHPAHAAWLGASQKQDAAECGAILCEQEPDWLVVDHYALDIQWEQALKEHYKKLLVIDDLADRLHTCDVLLDQNFYDDKDARYAGKITNHCQRLLGPRYALLREEFRQLHERVRPRKGSVQRILVFFGGVDADNYTGRAIQALIGIGVSDIQVDVVIGSQHPCRKAIEAACLGHNFACYVQTSRMAELMAAADLSIGAGGVATWERCCLGLPALVLSLADNQIDIARSLDSYGACFYAGKAELHDVETIKTEITGLLNSPDRLEALSERAYSLVDGLGAHRLCQQMGC